MAATTAQLLDAVEDALLGTLQRGVRDYTISTGAGPRALTSLSPKELLDLRDRLKRLLADETSAAVGLSWGHGVQEPMT